MNTLWVILNADKTAVIELFETSDADSKRHWDKFMQFPQGTVFCRRMGMRMRFSDNPIKEHKWYVSYFFWDDHTLWGHGDPKGVGWSACLAIPTTLKMLEFLE